MLEINNELQRANISTRDPEIKIEAVSSFDRLGEHAEAWNNLAGECPHRLPMVSYDWVASRFATQMEEDEGWFVLFAYRKEQLIGVLPIELKAKRKIAPGRYNMMTPASAAAILPNTGSEKKVASLFLEYIRALKFSTRGLHLRQVPGSSTWIDFALEDNREAIFIDELHGFGSYIKVQGSYEDYLNSLSSRFKRNIRRLGRKVEKLGEISFEKITEAESQDDLLDSFMEIEASGWKKRQGTSMRQQPELVSFYSNLINLLARHGKMIWYVLRVDEKILAMQLVIQAGTSLIITKIAYDEEYYTYSPGTLLFDKMVKNAFSAGDINEINCLTDHAWNRNWNMDRRPLYNLSIYPRRFSALFSILPQRIKMKSRIWGKSIPGLLNLYRRITGSRTNSGN